jgi:hypothetical protein
MKPSDFLQELQKEQLRKYRLNPSQLRKSEWESLKRVIEGYKANDRVNVFLSEEDRERRQLDFSNWIRNYKEAAKECPKYESLAWYTIMRDLSENIFSIIPSLRIELRNMAFFGSLSTGDVNAMAIPVPNSKKKIVVFEDQIFILCNTICKIVALSIPYIRVTNGQNRAIFLEDLDEIEKHVLRHKHIKRLFKDLLFSYLFKGEPGFGEKFLINPPSNLILDSIRLSMETFVMCHELAHIQLRHTGDYLRVSNFKTSRELKEQRNSWTKEYQADARGLALSRMIFDESKNRAMYYLGAHLFFSFNDILNKSIMIVRNGKEITPKYILQKQSHPPPMQRLLHLKKGLKGSHGKKCINASLITERILKVLWESTKNSLHAKYVQKKKLNEKFDSYLI